MCQNLEEVEVLIILFSLSKSETTGFLNSVGWFKDSCWPSRASDHLPIAIQVELAFTLPIFPLICPQQECKH